MGDTINRGHHNSGRFIVTQTSAAERTHQFQDAVLYWFATHQRNFPWRNMSNPFHILIAEMLLRQTQAKRISQAYLELIEQYPCVEQMARADVAQLRDWFKPLGLIKRADWMIETSKILLAQHGGQVPQDLDALMRLPGLGRYSARAVLCLAFDKSVPMVDESSGRLLRRVIGLRFGGPAYSDKELLQCAEGVVPSGGSKSFNLGLLDIAASYCHPRSPNCACCPLIRLCSHGRLGLVNEAVTKG